MSALGPNLCSVSIHQFGGLQVLVPTPEQCGGVQKGFYVSLFQQQCQMVHYPQPMVTRACMAWAPQAEWRPPPGTGLSGSGTISSQGEAPPTPGEGGLLESTEGQTEMLSNRAEEADCQV